MKNWEKALHKFLGKWRKRKEVLGAMATGSYVTGTASKFSDVDVHIFLSDDTKWRERGNNIISGFLIEYFANPIRQLQKYQKEDHKEGRKVDARMFAVGKIIFDKTGIVKSFQEAGKKQLQKPFKPLGRSTLEMMKYTLWDRLDNLRDLHSQKSPSFVFVYYLNLQTTIENYAKFLGAEIPIPAKLYRFFTDSRFRMKYQIKDFPDKKFVKYALECFKSESFGKMKKITHYALNRMGGFDINGWKLRTPAK